MELELAIVFKLIDEEKITDYTNGLSPEIYETVGDLHIMLNDMKLTVGTSPMNEMELLRIRKAATKRFFWLLANVSYGGRHSALQELLEIIDTAYKESTKAAPFPINPITGVL
jgi:hypothetical protein